MKQMTLEEISKAAASGAFRKIPVSREIYSDIRTPVETLKVLQGVSSHCYMLESVEDKKQWGRYTFLGYDPSLELTCVNGNLTITADAAEMEKVEDIPESRKEQLATGQIRLTIREPSSKPWLRKIKVRRSRHCRPSLAASSDTSLTITSSTASRS